MIGKEKSAHAENRTNSDQGQKQRNKATALFTKQTQIQFLTKSAAKRASQRARMADREEN